MKKKLENFIFYYKYHVIAAIFILIIVIVLWKDKSPEELEFVIVDDTSCLNMTAAESMMKDFEKQQKIKSGSTAFRYKSMYPSQENFDTISFEVAEIKDYEACFTDGTIDMVITTVDRVESAREKIAEEAEKEADTGEAENETDTEEEENETDTEDTPDGQEETAENENDISYYQIALLDQVLSEEEMSRYEKYLYYIDDEAVGIIFNKCKKAEEYFGDNYPTGYHYILQVAAGSAEDEQVKQFLRYLIGE